MGTVLAMIKHLVLGLGAAAILVSSCASVVPLVKGGMARVSGAASSVPIAARAPNGAPQILVTLRSRGVKFPMGQLDTDGGVSVWAANDASQVALRNGVLISSRGFGMDLMSADVPSIAELVGGAAQHSRTHFYLDGSDTPIRRTYTCTSEAAPEANPSGAAHHIIENCQGDAGTIQNEYWLDSAMNVIKSHQWLSQGVGYADFGPNAG